MGDSYSSNDGNHLYIKSLHQEICIWRNKVSNSNADVHRNQTGYNPEVQQNS